MSGNSVDRTAIVREALEHLLKGPEERKPFFDLLADDVVFEVACAEDTPIYGRKIQGKQAAMEYFSSGSPDLLEDVVMERPLEYIDDPDRNRVLVLGAESYTLRQLGVRIGPNEFVIVFDIRDGLIAKYFHIEDLSKLVGAFRNTGVTPPSWAGGS